MRARRKLSKTRRRIRKYIVVTLSLILVLICFFEFSVKRQLTSVLIVEMKKIIETSVAQAVEDFCEANPGIFEGLAKLHFSSSGVQAISTDSKRVNLIKTRISLLSQEYIDASARENGVSVPLGELTGLVLFYDLGPSLRFSVSSKQAVSCELKSSFESAGINQTVHHMTLCVQTEVSVYNPYRIKEPIESATSYEIAQTVIAGTVPSYSGVVTY